MALAVGMLAGCFDSTVPGDYYPGLDDNSTPPDPATYAVSGDVSGTLGDVTVNEIGGLTAAQISQGLSSIATATDSNQPSTLVARDSAGSFAANIITATQFIGSLNGAATSASSADWAQGRLGPDITSFGGMSLNGGSVFRVTATGSLTAASFPTGMASGTTVTLIFTGSPATIVHSASTPTAPGLLLRSGGNFRTANNGNDSITFVFVSGSPQGNWIEINRQAVPSEVITRNTLGQAVPDNSETTVNFDAEDRDARNEFAANTFVPSSTQTTYRFAGQITSDPYTWTAGDFCRVRVFVGGTPMYSAVQYPPDSQTQPCTVPITGMLRLGVGASVSVAVTIAHAGGTTLAADGTSTYFTINRVD